MPAAKSSLPGPDESVDDEPSGPAEIAIVGDLTDNATDLIDKLLSVEPGSECTIYFDSPAAIPTLLTRWSRSCGCEDYGLPALSPASAHLPPSGPSRHATGGLSLPAACSCFIR